MALKPITKQPKRAIRSSQTVEEFEAFLALPENRGRLFELVEGEVVEKMPTEEHGASAAWIATFINMFLLSNPIGRIVTEGRYRPEGSIRESRLPNVAFVAGDRPLTRQGAAPFLPDLCVEIQSPDDRDKQMADKAAFYLANGSKMVWLVYPSKRLVEVLTATDRQLLGLEDMLSGGDVLPGFSVAVKQIFAAG
jgi:Uma2 family endonuclease